ncbi:major facilitator superfamily domain-containing protein 12-like [Aethina tumida]|uniref:major facilitator superfamily domain-containing protein 12-like n=1 Tax=Aethina tumida TaxID=116153 RepID=UPI00096B41FA|nr:major facilitator superfamily domain-containing protein 12-like [Aethina tumida]XP_019872632.1 major facilitator superfamily domain-containing protein 12-like [Aethina tumida]
MSLRLYRIKLSKIYSNFEQFRTSIMESSSNHHSISDDYTEVYRRLAWTLQIAYGVGHVLNDVCASMWFTYFLVFFQYVLQFSKWQTGCLMFIGQVADALATPFVGFHSDQADNFWLCRYGRRKIWHLLGTICVLGAFPFIYSPCPGCSSTSLWSSMFYYSVFIIIFQFGWASVQISHLSLIPELTPNEHDRTKLTAVRYCFTVISNVLVYVVTWIVLHLHEGENSKISPKDGPKFQEIIWSVLCVGILCSAIFHIFVREGDSNSSNNVRGGQLRTSVAELLSRFEVYQVAFVYMSSRLFVNLTQMFIPLYLHETLDMTASSLAVVPLTIFVGSFATSLGIEKINRHCGRKITYVIGTILGLAACIWINFGENALYKKCFIYIVALLVGAGGSIILVTSLGVTTDLIGDRTDSGAFVFGIMSFTDKLANGIAVFLIEYLHNSPTYYREILTYVCGGSILVGAVAVISLCRGWNQRLSGYERIPDSSTIN